DERGRFTLTGLPQGITLTLLAADDRFARQTLVVNPHEQERAALKQRQEQGQPLPFVEVPAGKEDGALTWALTPVRAFEGTVTYADTGKPASGARVLLYAGVRNSSLLYEDRCETRTDEQGRYRIVPKDGRFFEFFVYPPAGAPYLLQARSLQRGPGASVKQQVEFKLPRGVLVRGKVTEGREGKPVAGASVEFVARKVDNPFYRRDAFASYPPLQQIAVSRTDGSFEVPILPGPGQLLVNGPTMDYLRIETSERALTHGKPGGMRHYPNGVVPLDLKPEPKEHPVTVTLTRGVTARGRLVGPDGKAVQAARIVGPAHIPTGYTLENVRALEVADGTFELPGCDPNGVTTYHILAPKEHLGLVLAIRGKEAAAGPLTVTLKPCASVQMRFVDDQGKPAAGAQPMLDLILTPGVSRLDLAARFGGERLLADGAWMINVDRDGHHNPKADGQGRFTLPNLIPGATFRVLMQTPTRGIVDTGRAFTAEAGKRQQLPDIPITTAKGGVE
ncbi:MAG: hypothetical protein L0Z62_22365, partial [Gemmataceae bacterium]|nr:hypothetical protein [Gemmataceae bacterium]